MSQRPYFRRNHEKQLNIPISVSAEDNGTKVTRVRDVVRFVEHYRIPFKYESGRDGFDHVAVVILNSGACFVGHARPSEQEQYKRSVGYSVSVGRALKSVVDHGVLNPDFYIDNELVGRELGEAVYNGMLPFYTHAAVATESKRKNYLNQRRNG